MKFSIYVPSKSPKMDLSNLHDVIVANIAGKLSDVCGGATAVPAFGMWKGENGNLISENVTIVHTFGGPEQEQSIRDVANYLLDQAKQDCVLLEIDGKPFFIEPITA